MQLVHRHKLALRKLVRGRAYTEASKISTDSKRDGPNGLGFQLQCGRNRVTWKRANGRSVFQPPIHRDLLSQVQDLQCSKLVSYHPSSSFILTEIESPLYLSLMSTTFVDSRMIYPSASPPLTTLYTPPASCSIQWITLVLGSGEFWRVSSLASLGVYETDCSPPSYTANSRFSPEGRCNRKHEF